MDLTISLLTALVSFTIALFVYFKNARSATHVLFSALIFVISLYPIFNYLSLNSQSPETAFFWAKFILFCAIPAGPLFYLFVSVFPNTKFTVSKKIAYVLVVWVIINISLAYFGFIFQSVTIIEGAPKIESGPAVISFGLLQVLSLIAGSWVLFGKYRRAQGLLKRQLQYISYGIVTSFGLTALTTLVLPLVFSINLFIPLSPLFLSIAGMAIAYSILRHRLLDIRLVVARTISYSLLIAVFGVFYAMSFAIFSSLFISANIESRTITVSTVLALIMAFTFQPIRFFLEHLTDTIFYKGRYDTDEVLEKLSRVMASTLRLDDLTHEMLAILLKEIRVGKAAFILLDDNKVSAVKHEGFKSAPTLDEEHIKAIAVSHGSIVFDETEEGEIKKILREMEISIVVHLRTEGEQIGLLILGDKQSGDIYSEQDVNLLEILAPEAAVAVQNAKAYEEIRRFNITLQEEVDKATTELTDANEKLKELDKLKDEFVSLASHELRTPMTAIKGSLSTILEGYAGTISPESREFLTAAYNENDRLIRLVNNLLNISRIEAGRFTFNLTKIKMNELIDEVIKNLGMAAQEKSLYLKYEGEKNLPLVYADEDKVKEVLINLIGNALKFTHKGGITVKTEIKNEMLQIGVCDTGSGIAKEDQELLFKKFSQVKGSYSRQAGGTGLGLYISKQIIEGQKGKVWLESVLGQGSTFFFTLPITT